MPAVEPIDQMKDLLKEADRQLTICNACRYCEGYCAVWPAMELRRTFKDSDILYLANLCFDCRACYYACQFAPPHQFAVNIPQVFAQIRTETYQDYSWPPRSSRSSASSGFSCSSCWRRGRPCCLGPTSATERSSGWCRTWR